MFIPHTELPANHEVFLSCFGLSKPLDEYLYDPCSSLSGTAVFAWTDQLSMQTEHSITEQVTAAHLGEGCPWTALTAEPVKLENRAALAFLKEWMSTPDEMGEEWWRDFDAQLASDRPSFREL